MFHGSWARRAHRAGGRWWRSSSSSFSPPPSPSFSSSLSWIFSRTSKTHKHGQLNFDNSLVGCQGIEDQEPIDKVVGRLAHQEDLMGGRLKITRSWVKKINFLNTGFLCWLWKWLPSLAENQPFPIQMGDSTDSSDCALKADLFFFNENHRPHRTQFFN